jgi:hypothetical protein
MPYFGLSEPETLKRFCAQPKLELCHTLIYRELLSPLRSETLNVHPVKQAIQILIMCVNSDLFTES